MKGQDVDDKQGLKAIHLFAGSGGGVLGGLLLGWRTVCAVELDEYCRSVLVSHQNDGSIEPFPIWDDVRTFDGRAWRGSCDVVCGGFPCQDCSPLGRRAGINGEKSGLWKEMSRIVGEVRPTWVFAENSTGLLRLGLDVVLRDLDALGYDAEWRCLSAAELGAPHIRDRLWILGRAREAADGGGAPIPVRPDRRTGCTKPHRAAGEDIRVLADSYVQRRQKLRLSLPVEEGVRSLKLPSQDDYGRGEWGDCLQPGEAWPDEPKVPRVDDGIPFQVEQLRGYGNSQVPVVAACAFLDLASRF